MTDDPYPSLPPVANAVTGFIIAFLAITLPFFSVALDRVKLNEEEVVSSRATGAQVETTTQQFSASTTPPDIHWL